MIKAGIVGGTGYSGVELLRLLAQHPQVEVAIATSRQEAGKRVSDAYPSLRGRVELEFKRPEEPALKKCDVVFFCTPNGVAMGEARALLDAGARIVDISADFRLKDVAEWERWYKMKHAAPDLVAQAVYGLCEVNRERIRGARLVANPGCYPTAVQLGLLPLVETGAVDLDHLIADAKSGVSGAGRKAEQHLLYSEAADNFSAYSIAGHRHWPEIRQGLAQAAGREVGLVFMPLSTLTFATLPSDLRVEAAGFYSLTRNLGQSAGISIMQTLFTRNTQVVHARLSEGVRPDNPLAHAPWLPSSFGLSSPPGLASLQGEVGRQAAMVAYIDVFHLMFIITLGLLPMVLLLQRQPTAPQAEHMPVE